MTPKATSTSAHRTSSGFGLMVPVSRSIVSRVLGSAGGRASVCRQYPGTPHSGLTCCYCCVLLGSAYGLRPTVAQRLSVRQVAAGQGRHGPAVPQLRRSRVDSPEETETRARQAGTPQHNVLRRVGSFAADQAERRRAREVVALLALVGRLTAYSVQVAA